MKIGGTGKKRKKKKIHNTIKVCQYIYTNKERLMTHNTDQFLYTFTIKIGLCTHQLLLTNWSLLRDHFGNWEALYWPLLLWRAGRLIFSGS